MNEEKAAAYARRALELRTIAAETSDIEHRDALIKGAQAYETMAQQALSGYAVPELPPETIKSHIK